MALTWNQQVFSSNVAAVGYDEERKDLIITWRKGSKQSAYEGVPEDLAIRVANAPSVGQILNMEIKPIYRHRYV